MIPQNYLKLIPNSFAKHLEWMRQKYEMRQDMFLLGPPTSANRRRLALAFAEANRLKVELLTLTHDTTESDLKQRREIRKGSLVFVDQAPLRACFNGHLLVLDGIERAERNVLPTLNNLLENREMQLEDSRLLVSHARYRELLENVSNREEELKAQGIVSAHPDFVVVALGSPCPPFTGRPLDPPLRSRFQGRVVLDEFSDYLATLGGTPRDPDLGEALEYADAISRLALSPYVDGILVGGGPSSRRDDSRKEEDVTRRRTEKSIKIPMFSPTMTSVRALTELTQRYPEEGTLSILSRFYPWLDSKFAKRFKASGNSSTTPLEGLFSTKKNITKQDEARSTHHHHHQLLKRMLQDHSVGRGILLAGPRACGKTTLARRFAREVRKSGDYSTRVVRTMALNHETSTRELIERRAIDKATGDTIWVRSPLLEAAERGEILVLDGLERLSPTVTAALSRLCLDREAELLDGTRVAVHPDFRVVATYGVASPESGTSGLKSQLPFPEDLPVYFSIHAMDSLLDDAMEEEEDRASEDEASRRLLRQTYKLNDELRGLSSLGVRSLNARQFARLRGWLRAGPLREEGELASWVLDNTLARFLPRSKRDLVEGALVKCGMRKTAEEDGPRPMTPLNKTKEAVIRATATHLEIGDISHPLVRGPNSPPSSLVPNPLFFDVGSHVGVMQRMLRSFRGGERNLLLIGNQGVGKNKLADRFLQLLGYEREYIQLHRDSTVGSLTLTPRLEGGRMVFVDSPLVRAATMGRCLVVDEGDKANTEILCVLKQLIVDGEMMLADGRRLVRTVEAETARRESDVAIHPDFCVFLLANRPGYPFLGNDLFGEVGDCFTVVVVDSPTFASETEMLARYAPRVDRGVLETLVRCFAELRKLEDVAGGGYPFSTRELVNVAKHLERFPEDGLPRALDNVLSFDYFTPEVRRRIQFVFAAHGVFYDFDAFARVHSGGELFDGSGERAEERVGVVNPLTGFERSEVWRTRKEA